MLHFQLILAETYTRIPLSIVARRLVREYLADCWAERATMAGVAENLNVHVTLTLEKTSD